MNNQIDTLEEAIALAEKYLEDDEKLRESLHEKRSKEIGRKIIFYPHIFTHIHTTEHEKAWNLVFHVRLAEGGSVDPGIRFLSIYKLTGEVIEGFFKQ